MSNLAQRAITAFFGVGIMVSGIWFSQWSFAVIFLVISTATLKEFYSLSRKNGYYPYSNWGLLFSSLLFISLFLNLTDQLEAKYLFALAPILTIGFLFPLYAKAEAHPLNCLAVSLMGILYIGVPFALLNFIAFKGTSYSHQIILGLLFAQWANDTGGYFSGRAFGKNKLFERVSPKKTWEGAIGGGVLTLVIMYVWSLFCTELNLIEWLGLGLIVSFFGSFGDLVESLFKRTFAIKDSGTVLKGHGGFLDRFDGLIIAIPFATAYLILVT